MYCRSTVCLNPKITVHARCRHTHLWQWVAWMVRPKWLHRPHNPLREGHLSRVGVEGLFLLDASWQTACLRHFALEYCISTNLYYICENTFRMSNKYWRILLLISVLLVTRPAAAQDSASKVSTTNSYDGLITEWKTAQFSSGTNSQRSTSYTTLFFIRDHLGSIRAVTDAQGHILERNAYYPFGLQTNQNLAFPTITTSLATLYPNSISSLPARRDLYNGKEIQTAAGTDYLDYGFRQYDPTAARWFNVDPMGDKYSSLTPYSSCAGNPISYIDFRGDSIIVNNIGNITQRIGNNTAVYLSSNSIWYDR